MVVNGHRCLMMFDMVWNQRVSLKPPVNFFASLRLRKLRNSWDGSKKNPAANSEERSVLLSQTEFHRISSLEVSCWLLFPSHLFNVGSVFSPTKTSQTNNDRWWLSQVPSGNQTCNGNFPIFIDDFPLKHTTFFWGFSRHLRQRGSIWSVRFRRWSWVIFNEGLKRIITGYTLGKTYENIIKHLIDVENPAGFPRKSSTHGWFSTSFCMFTAG